MIKRSIHVNDWDVDVFFCITHYDESVLWEALRKADAPIGVIVRMRQIARDDEYNTGFTCAGGQKKRCVVVIGKATSADQLLNTFCHEIYHLTSYIARAEGTNPFGEEAAYLNGDISARFTDIIGGFICPKCGHSGQKCGEKQKKIGQIP